ncbi:uncharacterized protein [Typha latifolia]|uniref:uncharacterized protein isoform X1 n=1 Tax=Typha latifolia TaxID=4733 RepID=UPI003C2FA8DB
MLRSKFAGSSLLKRNFSPGCFSSRSAVAEVAGTGDEKKGSLARRAVPILLVGLTGGVALSALNDLLVFHGCSSQAIEKASQNQKIVEAIGEPIVRGPWYNASLAVDYMRNSVSCTFPVSGPQGTGIFKLKAVRSGADDIWSTFLRHRDWDILLMDAILDVPSDDGNRQMLRITLPDNTTPLPVEDCKECKSPPCTLAK